MSVFHTIDMLAHQTKQLA